MAGSTTASAQFPAAGEVDWGFRISAGAFMPGRWHYKNPGAVLENDKWYSNGTEIALGGVARIGVGSNFFVEPSLSVWYINNHFKNLVVSGDGEYGTVHESDPKINSFGMSLPVVAGYTIPLGDYLGLSVFTGPELIWYWSSRAKTDLLPPDQLNLLSKNDMLGGRRRWEAAWRFGVSMPYDRYEIGVTYSLGMTSTIKSTVVTEHDGRLLINLGMYF